MENTKVKIVIIDLIIIAIFLTLTIVAANAYRMTLCTCFMSVYGPLVTYGLGMLLAAGLCFLNHTKNLKWYTLVFCIVLAAIICVFAATVIQLLADALNVGPSIGNSNF